LTVFKRTPQLPRSFHVPWLQKHPLEDMGLSTVPVPFKHPCTMVQVLFSNSPGKYPRLHLYVTMTYWLTFFSPLNRMMNMSEQRYRRWLRGNSDILLISHQYPSLTSI